MSAPLVRPKNISDSQWQKAVELYNTAKNKGDRYPELTVAQAALETGWFRSPSGKYNYFGQKATRSEKGTTLSTKEVSQGNMYSTNAKFKDYESIDDAVSDRIRKWGSKYKNASNIDEAIGSIWHYDPKTRSGRGYATDANYGSKIKSILNSMGVSSSQSNDYPNVEESEKEVEDISTYKPYEMYLSENFGEMATAGPYTEPKEVSEAKAQIQQSQQEENFVKEVQQMQQAESARQRSYLEDPSLFELYQAPQVNYQQPQFQGGGIIKDDRGYWNPNNWGKKVEISSPNITMKGVNQPLIGFAPETGEYKFMLPEREYNFEGATKVIESPVYQEGGE